MTKIHILLVLSLSLLLLQAATAQNFDDDPEVEEIGARIIDLSWEISTNSYLSDNASTIDFTVVIELWNPYLNELTSYGSSSCRWSLSSEVSLDNYQVENMGSACTDDYGPRNYPSGLSNETEYTSVGVFDASLSDLPDGQYLFSPSANSFNNTEDRYFGANMTVVDGIVNIEFEPHTSDWGMTQGRLSLEFLAVPVLISLAFLKKNARSHTAES